MPTPDELRATIATYVATVNARDPQDIAALFAVDAVQADPASQPPNIGREAIAAFFEGGIAASQDWSFEATGVHTCASTVAFDFRITVELGEGSMVISGIEVFDVGEDGLLVSAHAYWDDADVSFA
ncbi:MAG: nuclear transport factor 2 family protein [Acidimicrobiales bacterium]|jgi:steroid delta-isomerase